MCQTCQPMKDYQIVSSAAQLQEIKENAFAKVQEGAFTLVYDSSESDMDYREVQFLCEECGQVHILWLHTFMCRTGGEWRSLQLA